MLGASLSPRLGMASAQTSTSIGLSSASLLQHERRADVADGSEAEILNREQSKSASLIGRLGSSAFRLSTTAVSMSLTGSRFSSESAPKAFPSWGFEDEAEQSLPRPYRQTNDRSKRNSSQLTSSIVPRGTSFHRSVEPKFPPIASDPAQFSYRRDFSGPTEVGAIHPHTVHDDCHPPSHGDDRPFHPPRRAIFMPQALSHDHLIVRVSMTWAAS